MCESGFLGLFSPPMSSRAPTPLLLGLGQTEVKLSPGGRGDPAPHAAEARLLGCQGPPSPPAALPSRPPPPKPALSSGALSKSHVLRDPWRHLSGAVCSLRHQDTTASGDRQPHSPPELAGRATLPSQGRLAVTVLTAGGSGGQLEAARKSPGLCTQGAETPGPALSPSVWPGTKSRASRGGSCTVTLRATPEASERS